MHLLSGTESKVVLVDYNAERNKKIRWVQFETKCFLHGTDGWLDERLSVDSDKSEG